MERFVDSRAGIWISWTLEPLRNEMKLTVVLTLFASVLLTTGCRSPISKQVDASALTSTDQTEPTKPEVTLASSQPAHGSAGDLTDDSTVTNAAAHLSDQGPNGEVQLVSAVEAPVPLRTLGASEDLETYVKGAPGVVLLDFYADWCGPCRKQGKVLDELAAEARSANAQIIKVDFDQHGSLAKKFNVKSLPTLVVLKDGQVVHKKVGLTQRSQLVAMLK